MKFFTVTVPDRPELEDKDFYRKTALVRFLRSLPTLDGVRVYRHWWSRGDCVEIEEWSAEEFMAIPAKRLYAGATAQWEQSRGQFGGEGRE